MKAPRDSIFALSVVDKSVQLLDGTNDIKGEDVRAQFYFACIFERHFLRFYNTVSLSSVILQVKFFNLVSVSVSVSLSLSVCLCLSLSLSLSLFLSVSVSVSVSVCLCLSLTLSPSSSLSLCLSLSLSPSL